MPNIVTDARKQIAMAVGLAALAAASNPLWADEAGAPLVAQLRTASASESGPQLEEIVITARKSEESQQNVPIAVTALSGADLHTSVVLDVQDLQEHVTGLVVAPNSQGGAPTFAIRASKADNGTDGPAVYLNDMPLISTLSIANAMYDIDSVTVLKGPQGTLFGTNSSGGAIVFRPNRPSNQFEGYVYADAGNYDRHQLQAMINVPFSEVLQVRVAADAVRRHGFVTNLTPDPAAGIPDRLSDDRHESARLSVRVKPFGALTNDIVADYYRENDAPRASVPVAFTPLSTLSAANILGANTVSEGGNPSGVNLPLYNRATNWGIQDVLEFEFGDHASIKNLLGYRHDNTDSFEDNDGTRLDLVNGRTAHRNKLLVEELSLHWSTKGLRYVGGVYWSNTRKEDGNSYDLAQNIGILGFFGPTPPLPAASAEVLNNYYTRVFHSVAVYSQVDMDLTDDVTASLGARYNWDSGTFTSAAHEPFTAFSPVGPFSPGVLPDPTGNFYGGLCNPASIAYFSHYNPAACQGTNSGAWRQPSFTFSLQDKISDKTMLYATTRHGFQVGGFNNQIREQNLQTFKPEVATDFEFGVKSERTLAGRPLRTNIDAFYGNVQHKQEVENGSYADQSQWIAVFNAGSMTYYGIDFESKIFVTDNIEVGADWTHMKAFYDNFLFPAVGTLPEQNLAGNTPAQVPQDTVSASVNVTWPLPSTIGTLATTATYYYRSRTNFHDVINLGTFPADADTAPSYGSASFSTDWRHVAGTKLDIGIWIKNAFDKRFVIYKSAQAGLGYADVTYGDPRTFGANLRYSF
jgi:iron complex outermembrane receptor protein